MCRAVGTYFCIDMIQGCGVIPLDLGSMPVDFAVADGHKWLCAPEGTGIMYVRSELLDAVRTLEPGWHSVRHRMSWDDLSWDVDQTVKRYEGGSANAIGIAALGASVALIDHYGIESVWERVQVLTHHLVDGLERVECEIVSDRSHEHRSGIVVFKHPSVEPAEFVGLAADADIVVSGPRGGGIRVSPHAWNDEADIDTLVDFVAATR